MNTAQIPTTDQKIWLNLNKKNYSPGDQINGFLYIELEDSLADASILLKLKCNKLTDITDTTFQQAIRCHYWVEKPLSLRTKQPESKSSSEVLAGDIKRLPILPMGRLKIPIIVLLPLNLPASTEIKFKTGGSVRVKYTLQATLRSFDVVAKTAFEVVINNLPKHCKEKVKENAKSFGVISGNNTEVNLSVPVELMSCLPKGKITLCVQPKNIRLRPRGIVDLSLHTDLRQSDLDILGVEAFLERETLVQKEGEFLLLTEILAERKKGKIVRGRRRRNLQILLPFTCGRNEQTCTSERLGVKYQARLTFRMADCCVNSPSVLIPLYLERKLEEENLVEDEEDDFDLILGSEPFIIAKSFEGHKKAQDRSTKSSFKEKSGEFVEGEKCKVFEF